MACHPNKVAHFVFYLLKNRVIPIYYFDPAEQLVQSLMRFRETRNDLVEICNQLAELGYPNASGLRKSILEKTAEGGDAPS